MKRATEGGVRLVAGAGDDFCSLLKAPPGLAKKPKCSASPRWDASGFLILAGAAALHRRLMMVVIAAIVAPGFIIGARADSLIGALADAYRSNPQLNAQRAITRATDESVPKALSGYRPTITATATLGEQTQRTVVQEDATLVSKGAFAPRSLGISGTQTLFNGFRTGNSVRQAEQQVSAAREILRVIEQTVLLNAATAYMNLLRDTAILELQRKNVEVLTEQLRQTRDRFRIGEVTSTDVAQAESRLAAGRSLVANALSNYNASRAIYRQVIGSEPKKLAPASPVDRLSPHTLARAIASGRGQNPNVTAAMFGIDVQALQVKINEGLLYPTLSVTASAQQSWDIGLGVARQTDASVIGSLSLPIYQGGLQEAQIRSAKETLTQKRLDMETARNQAQSNVTQSWGSLEAAKAQILATQAQVQATEIALNGVREEARVGQRTTLDVLNAQQELVNARVALVTAQRDRVVASYALLASVGRLNPYALRLPLSVYDPMVHYQQVRDAWAGIRRPDGQ